MNMLLWMLALAAANPVPNDAQQAMFDALSQRHGVRCADVEALSEAPVEDLRFLVNHATLPPQVPMRAAACLVDRHAEVARADLVRWVADPDTLGLARLVFRRIDALPDAVGLEVAEAALAGPWRDEARPKIAASTHPRLRALAGSVSADTLRPSQGER